MLNVKPWGKKSVIGRREESTSLYLYKNGIVEFGRKESKKPCLGLIIPFSLSDVRLDHNQYDVYCRLHVTFVVCMYTKNVS